MAAETKIFYVPPTRSAGLIGRDAELATLHRLLSGSDAPALVTALQGTGGIGKTQLAVRYCDAHKLDYPGGIVWLSMADPRQAVDGLVACAEEHGLPGADDRSKARAVLGRLRGRPDALLVLDNVEKPELLDQNLPGLSDSHPRGLNCKLLVTSRHEIPECNPVRLDFLPSPADRALLLREAKRGEPEGDEAAELGSLLAMLGGLPLALVMTGRLLAANAQLRFAGLRDALNGAGPSPRSTSTGRFRRTTRRRSVNRFRQY